jgi:hypothetical protein
MSRYFLLTDETRKLVAECAWECIESPTQSKLATALGEVAMSIEFELNQLPIIQSFREANPNATFSDFYTAIHSVEDRL